MYKIIAALCLFACGISAVPHGSVSSIRTSAKLNNPFGIVEGVVSCGSAGQITQVRFTDCTRVPCPTVVGRVYTLEIDFKPTFSHDILNLKVTILKSGIGYIILDEPVEGSAVEAGGAYTLKYNIPITGDFMGLNDLKVEVIGDAVIELCAFAAVDISAA